MHSTPVVTVDGPSGAGKGTLSSLLAKKLGWHFLDSGAIYRVLAVAALHHDLPCDDEECVVPLATGLDVSFETNGDTTRIILEGEDVTDDIRTEEVGGLASRVSVHPEVREALFKRQRAFAEQPGGAVLDGRDIGTVIAPDADVKLFITASVQSRARRRWLEMVDKKLDHEEEIPLFEIEKDVVARDARDINRKDAPLKAAPDAMVIDTTSLDREQAFQTVLEAVTEALKES